MRVPAVQDLLAAGRRVVVRLAVHERRFEHVARLIQSDQPQAGDENHGIERENTSAAA